MAVDEEITPESLDQFIEWERTAVDTPPADQVLWTLEESLRLVEAVEKYGTASWNVIAAHIKTKTAEACRSRKQRLDEWTHPSPPLTEAFMEELDQRMRQFNSDWDQVKAFYPDRGDSARLRQQYWAWRQRVRLPHNRVWSNADVDCLRVAVAQLGYHRWLDVADRVGTKSAEQCKTKWHKLADPPSSIVTVTATATATDTTVAALRPPAIDEYVHLLFYLAVYHPHKIRSALPSILEWLPAPYQCHALAPEVDIHWKRVSRWLPTPNTELRLKRIVQKVPKLLANCTLAFVNLTLPPRN
ncbi:hypothetical protein BJ085DRAFT_31251 [Dimargaris cristalligena]|uniref:Homeodomain-like protein n=1 Tax=Dimargaris cristalligena TaxID=215637 RepID=A0A4P9ZWH4_9FUNG|nr:hypothetical protein BJ085DRAFT_31251 [Dimargaris cristalligena]|eukprot:RKP37212.1 hypothetical protein BJ085DRAFT_31251 [Dimargaris cristalligena]